MKFGTFRNFHRKRQLVEGMRKQEFLLSQLIRSLEKKNFTVQADFDFYMTMTSRVEKNLRLIREQVQTYSRQEKKFSAIWGWVRRCSIHLNLTEDRKS